MRKGDILKRVKDSVARHGWHVQHVLPGEDGSPSLSYTVGLTAKGLPELAIVGFDPNLHHRLLNDVARLMTEQGRRFVDWSESREVIQGYPVVFRSVPSPERVALFAVNLFPDANLFLLQIVLPDAAGLYPWDAGCDPQYVRLQAALIGTAPRPTH